MSYPPAIDFTVRTYISGVFDHEYSKPTAGPLLAMASGHTIRVRLFCGAKDGLTHEQVPVECNLFLPRKSRVTPEQGQELQPLLQAMLAAVQGQGQLRDVAAVDAAFAPFRSALCLQQNASPYCVRLDLDTLSDIAAVQTWKPGATCLMCEMPVGLREIELEITELHMNCAICLCLPDWMCSFTNLQVLCLDGDSSFERSPVTNLEKNLEFINDAHGWTKQPKYRQRMTALPECMGSLVSLTSLSLERMHSIVTLPSSLSQITGLTALTVEQCANLMFLPDLGPMPCLTKLVLKGAVCVGMPECVATWPLEQLELNLTRIDPCTKNDEIVDRITPAQDALAGMVGCLAGTLRELTLVEFGDSTFLGDLPVMPRLAKCVLYFDEDEYISAPDRSLALRSGQMPALTYLEGVTHFDDALVSLPLYHIRLITDLYTFPRAWETPMPSLLSIIIEGTAKDELVDNMQRFPEWFGGAIFPNLQELHVWHLDELSCLPASVASFTALTELSLFELGHNNLGEYQRDTHMATSILDPSIFQITTLRTLNIIDCDFKTLPPFFLPSLQFMRISGSEHLYEFPELSVRALPQLAVLELHNLQTIRTLPESLGELTALTRLHISNCFLESMPMSMHQLSGLRELTIQIATQTDTALQLVPFASYTADASALWRDVAMSLKGLRGLRKLCLSGSRQFSREDLIFIGLSLKAWPPPLLDIMDNKFPILGFRVHPHTRYGGHCVTMQSERGCEDGDCPPYTNVMRHPPIVAMPLALPYSFKLCWRELGLPREAALWDDAQILQYWHTMQLKIEAFACISHPRLCQTPVLLAVADENIALIADFAADWQREHLREISKERMSEREQASLRENARTLADMRRFERLLLLECRGLSPENTAAQQAASNERYARADEIERQLEIDSGNTPRRSDAERALYKARHLQVQRSEMHHNAYMYHVRQEERARMLRRMQELELNDNEI